MTSGTIEFRDTTKIYGSHAAVDSVSFDVKEGEFFSIVGPSGSGKSTTLMLLAGFVHPTRGDILIGGRSVAQLPPQKRGLGMMFQSYAIFPHLSVSQNIAFPLQVRGKPSQEIKKEVARVLELVRLEDFASRSPGSLSGGQLQRVALARAIVFRPSVLLMDEPLSALDKELRSHMQLELKRIQQDLGVTVIYVTHDQGEALSMSDRLAVMNHGRLEQLGTPRDLYERPANRFVAGFLGESNLVPATVETVAANKVHVRGTKGQQFSGLPQGELRKGHKVVLAIRPEKIRLADPGSNPADMVGEIRISSYGGESIRYAIDLEGQELIARAPNFGDQKTFAKGQRVAVNWTADDALVFAEEAR